MRQDPRATLQRALAAPSTSCVAAAAQAFHRQPALVLVNSPSQWPLDSMTVDCGASVNGVCFSPDGLLMLAAAGYDMQIRKVATGQLVTTLQGHTHDVTCCAWSADNTLLASGSKDGTVIIWDAGTGQRNYTLRGHSDWVKRCAFSPDGQSVLSCSNDKTLMIWSASDGSERYTLRGNSEVSGCCWVADNIVISSSDDGTTRWWRICDDNVVDNVTTFFSKGPATAFAATAGGNAVVVGTSMGSVEIVRWFSLDKEH